jgi:hypothetical protein
VVAGPFSGEEVQIEWQVELDLSFFGLNPAHLKISRTTFQK